jgi:hypothetical protein
LRGWRRALVKKQLPVSDRESGALRGHRNAKLLLNKCKGIEKDQTRLANPPEIEKDQTRLANPPDVRVPHRFPMFRQEFGQLSYSAY